MFKFQITPSLGVKMYYDNSRMVDVLGIQPTNTRSTIVDMANSLIKRGIVSKL